MNQMVFIHGPGAGGCADSFVHQLKYYPGSLAPTLPGHPDGTACPNVELYTEWVRGWLWSKDRQKGFVLVGFSLGGCIALQYGLDYPDEVKALVLMTTGMRPRERRSSANISSNAIARSGRCHSTVTLWPWIISTSGSESILSGRHFS